LNQMVWDQINLHAWQLELIPIHQLPWQDFKWLATLQEVVSHMDSMHQVINVEHLRHRPHSKIMSPIQLVEVAMVLVLRSIQIQQLNHQYQHAMKLQIWLLTRMLRWVYSPVTVQRKLFIITLLLLIMSMELLLKLLLLQKMRMLNLDLKSIIQRSMVTLQIAWIVHLTRVFVLDMVNVVSIHHKIMPTIQNNFMLKWWNTCQLGRVHLVPVLGKLELFSKTIYSKVSWKRRKENRNKVLSRTTIKLQITFKCKSSLIPL
jgi:hypothetical protein